MKPIVDYTLYVCTDRGLMSSASVEESVEAAIRGGATVIQLREKEVTGRQFYETALAVKKVTEQYQVPLIINDRIDIAMAVDAAGVHLGQKDLPVQVARKLLGEDKIIGISAAKPEEAEQAMQEGADYLGVGAMYQTSTKSDTRPVTIETLKKICAAVSIPIVVIGGIGKENAMNFKPLGINGIAVVSSVVAQKDVTAAAKEMKQIFLTGAAE